MINKSFFKNSRTINFIEKFCNYISLPIKLHQKGDTLFHSVIFPWFLMQDKNCKVKNIEANYDFNIHQSDFLFEDSCEIPERYLTRYKKVFDNIMSAVIKGKPNKRIKYNELFDLFYIMHTLIEKGFSHYTYKINDYVKFMTWFIKGQQNRKDRDRFVKDPDGTEVKDVQTGKPIAKLHSYASKLKQQKTSNFNFRINEINKDLEKQIPLLIKSNVISAVGDRKSPMTVADVAVDTDFIDATGAQIPEEFIYTNHGPDYEINEKQNVAAGGKRVRGNVNLTLPEHNKELYNIEQK